MRPNGFFRTALEQRGPALVDILCDLAEGGFAAQALALLDQLLEHQRDYA